MKKIVLFLVCVVFVICVSAQERVDGQKKYRIGRTSGLVTNIVGWKYDEKEAKWAGYYNYIWGCYQKGNNKTPIKTGSFASFPNIVSLRIREVIHLDKKYYILTYTYMDFGYEYPAIKEGRREYKVTNLYLLNEKDYDQFINPVDEASNIEIRKLTSYPTSLINIESEIANLFKGDVRPYGKESAWLIIKKETNGAIRINSFMCGGADMVTSYFEISSAEWNKLKLK